MAVRTIVQIDEEICDGCGLCVPGCAEGALQIVDGKAKLVSDIYCDGLGACLGDCPLGAITMVEREADEFDEEAVNQRLEMLGRDPVSADDGHDHGHGAGASRDPREEEVEDLACGCPGTMTQSFERPKARDRREVETVRAKSAVPFAGGGCPGSASRTFEKADADQGPPGPAAESGPVASRLGNWPVQIMLVPPRAPYLDGADLLIAADCAPFAYGDFHRRFMQDKVLLIGCPKLDNAQIYIDKLGTIFRDNDIRSIAVVYMEVPCCTGLVQQVQAALEKSGSRIPTTLYRVGIKGDFVEERTLDQTAA